MRGVTHLAFGLFIGQLIFIIYNAPLALFFAVIGSIFPDIDIASSLVGRTSSTHFFFKHRGFFHTFYAAIIFSLIISLVNLICGISFLLGYSSHLLLDSMTKQGVIFIYGRTKGSLKYGGFFDNAFLFLFVMLNILMLFFYL